MMDLRGGILHCLVCALGFGVIVSVDEAPAGVPLRPIVEIFSTTAEQIVFALLPFRTHGPPVERFKVAYKQIATPAPMETLVVPANVILNNSQDSSFTFMRVRGLHENTQYSFIFYAISSVGESRGRELILSTPMDSSLTRFSGAIGSPPRHVIVRPVSPTSVAVEWDKPEKTHGATIEGYRVFYTHQPGLPIVLWESLYVTNENVTIRGLGPNRTYTFSVLAFSRGQQGPLSDNVQVIIRQEVPLQPRNLVAKAVSPTEIELNWDPPVDSDRIISYTLVYNDTSQNQSSQIQIQAPTTEFKLTDLIPDSTYHITLTGTSKLGESGMATKVQARTLEFIPKKPKRVRAGAINATAISVQWRHKGSSPVVGYHVHFAEINKDGDPETIEKVIDVQDPNVKILIIGGLKPSTRYSMAVSAYSRKGDGVRSKRAKCSTKGPVSLTPPVSTTVPSTVTQDLETTDCAKILTRDPNFWQCFIDYTVFLKITRGQICSTVGQQKMACVLQYFRQCPDIRRQVEPGDHEVDMDSTFMAMLKYMDAGCEFVGVSSTDGTTTVTTIGHTGSEITGCSQDSSFQRCFVDYATFLHREMAKSQDMIGIICSTEGQHKMACVLQYVEQCPELMRQAVGEGGDMDFTIFAKMGGIETACAVLGGASVGGNTDWNIVVNASGNIHENTNVNASQNTAPPTPVNVTVERMLPFSILVNWDKPTGEHVIAKYRIYYSPYILPNMSVWDTVDTDGETTVAHITNIIHHHAAYYVRVKALSVNNLWSEYSDVVSSGPLPPGLEMTGCVQVLAQDTNFQQCSVGFKTFLQREMTTSQDILGIICSAEGQQKMACLFKYATQCPEIMSTAGGGEMNFTSFTNMAGLKSACAVLGRGDSNGNTSDSTAPPAPVNVTAVKKLPFRISVGWDQPTGKHVIAKYRIYYNPFILPDMSLWETIDTNGKTSSAHIHVPQNTQHTSYAVRVRAMTMNNLWSDYSDVATSYSQPSGMELTGCSRVLALDSSFQRCFIGFTSYLQLELVNSDDTLGIICSTEGQQKMACLFKYATQCPEIMSTAVGGNKNFTSFTNMNGLKSICAVLGRGGSDGNTSDSTGMELTGCEMVLALDSSFNYCFIGFTSYLHYEMVNSDDTLGIICSTEGQQKMACLIKYAPYCPEIMITAVGGDVNFTSLTRKVGLKSACAVLGRGDLERNTSNSTVFTYPRNISATAVDHGISVTWTSPPTDLPPTIFYNVNYTSELQSGEFRVPSTATNFTLGLLSGSTYRIQISTTEGGVEGEMSPAIVVKTRDIAYECYDRGVAGQSCSTLEKSFESTKKMCKRAFHECCDTCSDNKRICKRDKHVVVGGKVRDCSSLVQLFGKASACTMFTKECCVTCREEEFAIDSIETY